MKNKGITLVALIITIIVLLILATVSISLVINNGILEKAQNGVDKYSEEEELEQIKLAVASAKLKGNGFLDTDNLNSELHERIDENENAEKRENTWYYKEYIIDESGKVEKIDKLLPKEYQQVEYIESSGTQLITTDKFLTSSDVKIQLKLQFTSQTNNEMSIIGNHAYNSENSFCAGVHANKFYVYQKNPGIIYGNNYISNQIYIYYIDFTNDSLKLIIDGETKNTRDNHANINTSQRPIQLISRGDGGYKSKIKLYYVKIIQDNGFIGNFIPCYNLITVTDVDGKQCFAGTVGLYDTVEGKFYTNQGTGTFGYGMEDGTYVAPKNN